MKIYPDIIKLWAKRNREAGMTKNQAKTVLKKNEELSKLTEAHGELSAKADSQKDAKVAKLLQKLNIF